jgi:HD-like signal output (HDOD) protein
MIETDNWRRASEAAKLFSLPAVYLRLRAILDNPDFRMHEVVQVISQDPAITFRLLRIVNSRFYGLVAKVETVDRAVTLLGVQQVHDLVLATAVAESFSGVDKKHFDVQRYWRRSLGCAVIARRLAQQCGSVDPDRVFVAGLLHDLGHLILFQALPILAQEAQDTATKKRVPVYRVERILLGFDYGGLGGVVMRRYSLPDPLVETTMFHMEPEKAVGYPVETCLVHIAAQMSAWLDHERVPEPLQVEELAWRHTGLNEQICQDLLPTVREDMVEALQVIRP